MTDQDQRQLADHLATLESLHSLVAKGRRDDDDLLMTRYYTGYLRGVATAIDLFKETFAEDLAAHHGRTCHNCGTGAECKLALPCGEVARRINHENSSSLPR